MFLPFGMKREIKGDRGNELTTVPVPNLFPLRIPDWDNLINYIEQALELFHSEFKPTLSFWEAGGRANCLESTLLPPR